MSASLRIAYLADHPEALPELQQWFEKEWADYYGPNGPGDAAEDLRNYSNRNQLPIGLVAFNEDQLCGIMALKTTSIDSHKHLSPWAAAGFVFPQFRRQGIGTNLVHALENLAKDLGYTRIFAGTNSATAFLVRNGWQFMEVATQDNEKVSVYQKNL